MRHIMVLNPKGGCGKSTLATNLAAYYASGGSAVALADFDPQGSSTDWLAARPATAAPVVGLEAWEDGLKNLPRSVDVVVMDPPARVHGRELTDLVRRADTIIVPVLPSGIDIRASLRFIIVMNSALYTGSYRISRMFILLPV